MHITIDKGGSKKIIDTRINMYLNTYIHTNIHKYTQIYT